jgi:hypothetical protein
MSALTASREDVDLLEETLYAAEDLLMQIAIAIGDAKTAAGTSRAEQAEARVHTLVEDLALEHGITVTTP